MSGLAQTVLVTGAAGFIGFHLSKRLLQEGVRVVGYDNMCDARALPLKHTRLQLLRDVGAQSGSFAFVRGDITDGAELRAVFDAYAPQTVVHLAAQAGVRNSIDHPERYVQSNLVGFCNVLEVCRHASEDGKPGVENLVFASSSSVYGASECLPYATSDSADRPASLYAATKRSNELMAYAYAKLFDIATTALRFFTVYGPYGRPDMAYFRFADAMVRGEPIRLYNNGDMYRDFTYIDDVVEALSRVLAKRPPLNSESVRYKVYNVGNSRSERLTDFVSILERSLMAEGVIDAPAARVLLPMQPGDVHRTCADVTDFATDFGFRPSTSLPEGLRHFAAWYKRLGDALF